MSTKSVPEDSSRAGTRASEHTNDAPEQRLVIGLSYDWKVYDVDGALLREGTDHNLVPTAALNDVLSVYLVAGAQKTTWYLGLVNNSGFSAFAASDTSASHAGWTELTSYDETTRRTVTFSAPASGSTNNTASPVSFTASGSIDIKGLFLISVSTKGGTTGILFSEAAFNSVQSLTVGQVLTATITAPATST